MAIAAFRIWTAPTESSLHFTAGGETLGDYVKQLKLIFTKEGATQLGGFGTIGSIFPKVWDWQIFWNMTVGEKETIHVCCGAQTPIKPSNFTWKSSKPSVATVNAKGKVTPKKKGSFTLTATLKSNPSIVVKQKIKVVK